MADISPHVEIDAVPDGIRLSVRGAGIVLPLPMAREVAARILSECDRYMATGMASLPLPEAKVRGDPIK